jgi:small-conductance mechanosensitive channel
MVDGREILRIYEPIGPFSAEMRAKSLEARIEALGKDPSYNEDELTITEGHGGTEFRYRGGLMGILTDEDAASQGVTRQELADRLLQVAKNAIMTYREEHSTQALVHNILFAVLAVVVLVLALFLTRLGHRWLEARVDRWCEKDGWLGKKKALGMVGHLHLARAAIAVLRILRMVLAMVFVYVALATVFSLFPWTREMAGILANYGLAPLRVLWGGFLKQIPNLLFIAVLCVVAYFTMRLLRWFFDRIGEREINVTWIDPEWAPAYYRIFRTVVLIGVAVIIFPYIPGSNTPAFKGISIFLGALATFGSSTAISNLVNGLILMTMRPYHTGDWVRVGDTEGRVLEVSLLVTRLRTPKNVVVTVPSSQVVGSHILNFTEEATGGPGLILHTTVTIGYDAPWRTVEGLMIDAALNTFGILREPAPFVLQTSLDDSYVSYQINAFTREACDQPRLYSELHKNIQEAFNAAGVEIMSPAYHALRDGNAVTIPAAQRPKGYEPPAFRVKK